MKIVHPPVVKRSTGTWFAPWSVLTGFILSFLVRTVESSAPAAYLPWLNHVAELSAELLLKDTRLPLGIAPRLRTLRSGTQLNANNADPHHALNQTVLLSYRYPAKPSFKDSPSDTFLWMANLSFEAPYRLLHAIEDRYNLSYPTTVATVDELQEAAASIITRNIVLTRLYHSILNPSLSLIIGLQSNDLPFECAYLTGLHMEVLSAPPSLSAQAIRETLRSDPLVEDVWTDEILEGGDSVPPPKHVEHGKGAASEDENAFVGAGRSRKVIPADNVSLLSVLPSAVHQSKLSEDAEALFEPVLGGIYKASPDDTYYHEQWALHDPKAGINCPGVWQEWTAEGTNFPVALIDSGVDLDHYDLRTQYWRNLGETDCFDGIDNDGNGYIDDCIGWDWVDNDNIPHDENGHGTASAGIIAAIPNNGVGVAGLCWGCRLLVLRTLDREIRGTISGFIKAIDYAVVQGVKVSNNSYGGRGSSFASLRTAVRRAKKHGMIFVAAAGNYGSNNDFSGLQPTFPASYNDSNIVSVAAIDKDGNLAPFSCYGRRTVDLAAPGVRILTTGLRNRYVHMDGTSFATPFVTAAAALLWSWQPDLTENEVIGRLVNHVRKLPSLTSRVASGGTLDLYRAMYHSYLSTYERRVSKDFMSLSDSMASTLNLRGVRCYESDPCPDHSTCVDTLNGPQCRCIPGFRHTRGKCLSNDQCSPNDTTRQCKATELCDVSTSGLRCVCRPGFAKINGFGDCKDIDECALDPFICPREAACLNNQGSFDCQCPPGTNWNGLAWIQRGAKCDVDRNNTNWESVYSTDGLAGQG